MDISEGGERFEFEPMLGTESRDALWKRGREGGREREVEIERESESLHQMFKIRTSILIGSFKQVV